MQLILEMGESQEKVVAVTKIPRGATSSHLSLDKLSDSLGADEQASKSFLQVGIWTSGKIQPLNLNTNLKFNESLFWIKFIKTAPDCHDQNVQMIRVNASEVVLEATKDIHEGQELLLWFTDDILVDEMGIPPYLNPCNIRAGNCYVCHLCSKEFEAPNNLKIHIALKCSSLPRSILWRRLKTRPLRSSSSSSSSNSPSSHIFPSIFTLQSSPQPIVPLLMPPPPMGLMPPHSRSGGGFPVARTFDLTSSQNRGGGISPSPPPSQHNNHTHLDLTNNNNNNNNDSNRRSLQCAVDKSISATVVTDPHAQLESIVSNMGKARNGHLCLYCGKLYSRKYGLKIHIRTHTGYKPLRCRICHRPFGDPSNLNKHIRLHSDGNTPYRCDICQKVLVRKRDLERHIRSRHGNSVPAEIVLDCTINNNGNGNST